MSPRLVTVSWHANRRPSALLDAFVEATLEACAGITAAWAAERAA